MTHTPKDALEALAEVTPYQALKGYGHSPAKAVEIALDAKRGHNYAKLWLDLALRAIASAQP